MNDFVVIQAVRKMTALVLLAVLVIFGSALQTFAHGGEDHGESKPKTTAGEKGTVSHSARLGDLEVMIKHSLIEPDHAAAARLFITNFQTNAPADKVSPAVEIESENGSVSMVAVEKTDSAGSYNLKIPAVPAGNYKFRAKMTYGGETDTTTFTGIEVKQAPAASAEAGDATLSQAKLAIFFGLIVLGLFAGLIYFAVRAAKQSETGKEAVSI